MTISRCRTGFTALVDSLYCVVHLRCDDIVSLYIDKYKSVYLQFEHSLQTRTFLCKNYYMVWIPNHQNLLSLLYNISKFKQFVNNVIFSVLPGQVKGLLHAYYLYLLLSMSSWAMAQFFFLSCQYICLAMFSLKYPRGDSSQDMHVSLSACKDTSIQVILGTIQKTILGVWKLFDFHQ